MGTTPNTIQSKTPATFVVQFSIPAGADAGTQINSTMQSVIGGQYTPTKQVPPNEVWALKRMYADSAFTAATGGNFDINIVVSDREQSLNVNTAVMVVGSGSFAPINPFDETMIIDSGESFYFYGVLTETSSATSATTENLKLYMIQYPRSLALAMNKAGQPL